jgi:hypothetical protein
LRTRNTLRKAKSQIYDAAASSFFPPSSLPSSFFSPAPASLPIKLSIKSFKGLSTATTIDQRAGRAQNEQGVRELLLVDQFELLNKVDEVLEAGVEVRLGAEADDLLEVRVVDVGVDAEEAREDLFDDALEVLWERRA